MNPELQLLPLTTRGRCTSTAHILSQVCLVSVLQERFLLLLVGHVSYFNSGCQTASLCFVVPRVFMSKCISRVCSKAESLYMLSVYRVCFSAVITHFALAPCWQLWTMLECFITRINMRSSFWQYYICCGHLCSHKPLKRSNSNHTVKIALWQSSSI